MHYNMQSQNAPKPHCTERGGGQYLLSPLLLRGCLEMGSRSQASYLLIGPEHNPLTYWFFEIFSGRAVRSCSGDIDDLAIFYIQRPDLRPNVQVFHQNLDTSQSM